MDRGTLRALYLHRRKDMPSARHKHESQRLCQRLQRLVSTFSPDAIHSFLPIDAQKEPDIMPFLHTFSKNYGAVFTSVAEKGENELKHVRFEGDLVLKEGPLGIPTPIGAVPISLSALQSIDRLLVVVPLLAFDEKGHRLGYGKGYYDRMLASLPRAYALGVSFEPPVSEIPPISTDIPLHACVTPARDYIFKPFLEHFGS